MRYDNDETIRGDIVYAAMERLTFGRAFTDVINEALESHRFVLDSRHRYTYRQLETTLTDLFGETTAHLIVEKLAKDIRAQLASGKNASL